MSGNPCTGRASRWHDPTVWLVGEPNGRERSRLTRSAVDAPMLQRHVCTQEGASDAACCWISRSSGRLPDAEIQCRHLHVCYGERRTLLVTGKANAGAPPPPGAVGLFVASIQVGVFSFLGMYALRRFGVFVPVARSLLAERRRRFPRGLAAALLCGRG